MKITLHKGGTRECRVEMDSISVPDLWHITRALKTGQLPTQKQIDMIEECWHLCHDLRRHIQENG